MINLRLTFTEQEIKEYFEQSGYSTGTKTLGEWRRVSHGEDRWVEYDTLVVYLPNGSCMDVRELLQGLISWQFKKMILNNHASVEQYVKTNQTHA